MSKSPSYSSKSTIFSNGNLLDLADFADDTEHSGLDGSFQCDENYEKNKYHI